MTETDLARQSCPDCLPEITLHRLQGVGGPVLVAIVAHAETCPWIRSVAPESAAIVVPPGAMPELDSVTKCTGAVLVHLGPEAVE